MQRLRKLYFAPAWRIGIGLAVLLNSIVLGAIIETPEGSPLARLLGHADRALLSLLVLDVALCIAVKRRTVLRSGWDIFDITVTLLSVVPSFGPLAAFRVLRVIRVLRLISFVPHGRAMVDAMLGALHNMAAAFVVLGVVFYSFVVITTNLFRDADPVHYGALGRSAAHLYTVMVTLGSNLDSEAVLADDLWALPIFAVFIILASFGLLNMFIAVLVAALREELERETNREERERFDRLERKIDALAALVAAQGDVQGDVPLRLGQNPPRQRHDAPGIGR
jgi:voltage-gated sodium channel